MGEHVILPPFSNVVKFRNQDFEKIRNHCSQEGILWKDPKFIPDIGDLIWKRPWEIVSSPSLFVEDVRQDIREGKLDDGYLVVAMQALTKQPQLLHWVVPQDQQCTRDNAGVVHFRIWQLGTWYDICVDDRLPSVGGKLAYTHSHNANEFWCALLEKAYAKLYGSYRVLEVGHSADALVDFTGGLPEYIQLDRTPIEFGNMLVKAYEKNLLMCCSISEIHQNPRDSIKILKDVQHYSVTKVQYLAKLQTVLVRLKDPKGLKDSAVGTWGDSTCDYRLPDDETYRDIDLETDSDREFWVSETDLKEYFTTLSICHLSPDTFMDSNAILGPSKKWWVNSFKGEWVRGVSAGGTRFETIHQNFQYRITLADPDDDSDEGLCSVVVSLMQKNKTRQTEWNLGFKIFKLDNPNLPQMPLGHEYFATNPHNFGFRFQENSREVVKRQNLLPGVYCLIPSTKGTNEEGEFMLRVFTGKKITMEKSDKKVSVVDVQPDLAAEMAVRHSIIPVAEESRTDEDVFKLFCKFSGKDMSMDWEGLKKILDTEVGDIYKYTFVSKMCNVALVRIRSGMDYLFSSNTDNQPRKSRIHFSKNLCRTLIFFMDETGSGRIGIDEFDQLWSHICQWKLIFRLHSKRKRGFIEAKNLSIALEKLGFVLNKEILGVLIQRYGDEQGNMAFDDFIMCAVTLQLDLINFQKSDKQNTGKVVVTLNEWIEKSTFIR